VHFIGFYYKKESLTVQDEGTTFLWKVRDHWPTNRVSQPSRTEPSLTGTQKYHVLQLFVVFIDFLFLSTHIRYCQCSRRCM